MKISTPEKIRNFVVAGHNGCGKTTLCDLMLYKAGAVDRLGSVDAKTSISDFNPDEQEKRSSIYSSYLNCVWDDVQMFFTDTPGYGEFVGEMISSFRSCGFRIDRRKYFQRLCYSYANCDTRRCIISLYCGSFNTRKGHARQSLLRA